MNEKTPCLRRDIEFFPVQHGGRQFILIRDHLGLVPEGKAVDLHLYEILTLLDGHQTIRDLQMVLMRQKGGLLVGSDEVRNLVAELDASFLLNSKSFETARDQLAASFTSDKIRSCFQCGRSYPKHPTELKQRLDEILASQPDVPDRAGSM